MPFALTVLLITLGVFWLGFLLGAGIAGAMGDDHAKRCFFWLLRLPIYLPLVYVPRLLVWLLHRGAVQLAFDMCEAWYPERTPDAPALSGAEDDPLHQKD